MESDLYPETGKSPDAQARLRQHLARRRDSRDRGDLRRARRERDELRSVMAALLSEESDVTYEAAAS